MCTVLLYNHYVYTCTITPPPQHTHTQISHTHTTLTDAHICTHAHSHTHSLQQFVKGTGSFVNEMAEAVLNGLTNNRHSKFVEKLKGPSKDEKTTDKVKEEPKETSTTETSNTSQSAANSPVEKDGITSPVPATKEISSPIENSPSETPPILNNDPTNPNINYNEESRSSFQESDSRVESRLSSPLSDLVNSESVRSSPSLNTEELDMIGSSGSPRSVSGTPATGRSSRASSNSDHTSLDSDGNKVQGDSSVS